MMHGDFLNNLDALSPIIGGAIAVLGWMINYVRKRVRELINRLNSAHSRLNAVDLQINNLKDDLTHFMTTVEKSVSDKVGSIQSAMTNQFNQISASIERILVLMVKKKD